MAGFVVVGGMVRCVVMLVAVSVMAHFLFLFWRSRCDRGLGGGGEIAVILQIFNFVLYPVLSAVDVLHCVVVVDERDAGKHSIKHPMPCTHMSKVSFLGAVVAVGRRSSSVLFPLLHRRPHLCCDVVLSPDLWTSVKEVSRHAAAMTLFVPVRPLAARTEQVTREATVVAVLIGTFTGDMARGAT